MEKYASTFASNSISLASDFVYLRNLYKGDAAALSDAWNYRRGKALQDFDKNYEPAFSSLDKFKTNIDSPSNYNGIISRFSIPAHATGSNYAENAFIAGENGPELILGAEGAKVFTNSQTEKLLSNNFSPTVNITLNGNNSNVTADIKAAVLQALSELHQNQKRISWS
jgi:hypothetical protein